eukprot:8973258-Pyramimonas_sp.AAC.1
MSPCVCRGAGGRDSLFSCMHGVCADISSRGRAPGESNHLAEGVAGFGWHIRTAWLVRQKALVRRQLCGSTWSGRGCCVAPRTCAAARNPGAKGARFAIGARRRCARNAER